MLTALVKDAMTRNLSIDTARYDPVIAEAAIQGEQGLFDPHLDVQPIAGRSWQTVVTEEGRFKNAFGLIGLGNGSGGLSPSSGVAVGGLVKTGGQYRVSFESSRQAASVRALTGNLAPQFDNAMTVSIAQPLMRGKGARIARAGIRAADIGAQRSRAGYAHVINQTIAEIETAYWTAVYARAIERVTVSSLSRARILLDRNEQLLQLSLVANLDVLTARQGVAARTAALTEARQQRLDATEAVAFMVYGREAAERLADDFDLDSAVLPLTPPPILDADGAYVDAVSVRADLREAELREEQAKLDVEVARDSIRPSLNLTGSYTALTQNSSGLRLFGANGVGDFANVGWQGGVSFSLPIGNNTAKADLRQATLAYSQNSSATAAVENQIHQEVRQAQRALEMTAERVRQTTEALRLANEEYQGENQRLQLGLSDSFRLLQVEDHVNGAQQEQLQARFDLALAMVEYKRARGMSAAHFGVDAK